jgi:hypothetical protein
MTAVDARPDIDFACLEVVADRYAAGPTVVFKLRATVPGRVHAGLVRCQVRVEPIHRSYSSAEAERVADLFGDRSRWGESMHPMQLAFLTQVLPTFEDSCDFDLAMPCSYDVDVAAHKYLAALAEGFVPLLLLFSGTLFTGALGSLQVQPVPWHKEARVGLPVAVWREAMDAHFPGQAWLRLSRSSYDRLAEYRSQHGLLGWDEVVSRLLDSP